jgi:hypothetical protein
MVAIPLFSRNDRRVIANAALSFAEVVGRWSLVVRGLPVRGLRAKSMKD